VQQEKFGIYLNTRDNTVMRISSPYWIPSGDEWAFITSDVNATLLSIRALAREMGVVSDPDSIMWGDWGKVPRRE
jgi:hypothetical protein